MLSKKRQFSIRNLLLFMLVVAFLIQAIFLPKGYLVYIPLLVILLLALSAGKLLVTVLGGSPQRKNYLQLVVVVACLIVSVLLYIPAFEYASTQLNDAQLEADIRTAVFGLADPDEFRSACLVLHAKLLADESDSRIMDANSDGIPEIIKRAAPRQIIANDDFLFLKMTKHGSGIAAYPWNSKRLPPPTNPGATVITKHLYYWQTK